MRSTPEIQSKTYVCGNCGLKYRMVKNPSAARFLSLTRVGLRHITYGSICTIRDSCGIVRQQVAAVPLSISERYGVVYQDGVSLALDGVGVIIYA